MPSGFLGGGVGPNAFGGGGLPNPVPVAGADVVANGNFSAWSGDNPTGWTVLGESGSDPMVTEVAGTCRIYTSAAVIGIGQISKLTIGVWYRFTLDNIAVVSGYLHLRDATGGSAGAISIPSTDGTVFINFRAPTTGYYIHRVSGLTDFTIDNVSTVPLTLASLLSTRAYASANCDLSAAVTRTAGTQAGLVARLDSAINPQNFILSYLDGAGNLKTDTCISGTYANVAGLSGAVSYVAGRVLRLVIVGTDVSVYYNGTQVGSTTTVTHANLDSNTRHGKFSTYASNTLTGFVAA